MKAIGKTCLVTFSIIVLVFGIFQVTSAAHEVVLNDCVITCNYTGPGQCEGGAGQCYAYCTGQYVTTCDEYFERGCTQCP